MEKGFTLIIPLYNKDKSILVTLNSVLINHGDYPFKCIVVDDDSTDNSSIIAESFDICYPNVFQYYKIKHHGNKTPVFARNVGIKLCETKYIGFLDADDELCPGFIDRACNFLDEHPEYSMYTNGHRMRIINDNGEITESSRNYSFNNVNDFIDCLYAGAQDISFCSSVYLTDYVKDNLFIDVYGEDSIFKLKYIYKHPNIYVDNSTCESIIWNTQHSGSYKWSKQKTNETPIIEVFNTLKNELPGFKYDFIPIENNRIQIWEK